MYPYIFMQCVWEVSVLGCWVYSREGNLTYRVGYVPKVGAVTIIIQKSPKIK